MAFCAALVLAVPLRADSVPRGEALGVATARLPSFFPGDWRPAGEITLHDLEGGTLAYAFIFSARQGPASAEDQEDDPKAFLAAQRQRLVAAGKGEATNASELYGADRFATIVVSAEDTEPPVLRCFRGLPGQMVREPEALALAGGKAGAGAWKVRHCLLLGFFDEAFLVDPEPVGGESLVVDLRTGSVVSHAAAKERAKERGPKDVDSERARRCQEAWRVARGGVPAGPAPAPAPATPSQTPRKPKVVDRRLVTPDPLLPAPQGNGGGAP